MIAIDKTTSFTFCKMCENVSFFEHMHSKLAKSAKMTKFFVFIELNMGYQKIAEFHVDPENQLKQAQEIFLKKDLGKKLCEF